MPKNIAVFADGTGNTSAKFNRTNVWRIYQALDTRSNPPAGNCVQFGYYHDGVGTSSFRPLAVLGGAFGWGLKRNLLDMYKFISRNYEEDDRIYLFGFSRGSFTVRVLASFICTEGLVRFTGDEKLDTYARDAYRDYRACFNQTGGLVQPLRKLRNGAIQLWRRVMGGSDYAKVKSKNYHPNIAFVGVFDTVAAYGTPIAELTRGIDEWVWPLSMPDYHLSPKVEIGRHALALDDERDTFHPLLWDETTVERPERIKQVWFAGVHSDVGGGYPDDTMSYIPLEWMVDQARQAGLRFIPKAVREIRTIASWLGPMHDSRRGLAGYYRYQPRKISARLERPDRTTLLMQDPTRDVQNRARLKSVNIHQSVFERIKNSYDGYAPIVVNGDYTIIPRRGETPVRYESKPRQRARRQERVWDWVWHKRVNYFLSVGVSLYLAALPAIDWCWPPASCAGPQCLLSPVISTMGEFLPGFAAPWISAFAKTPGRTVVAVGILAFLLWRGEALQNRIRTDMRTLWEESLGLRPVSQGPLRSDKCVRRLRRSHYYQRSLQSLKWRLAPNAFGVTLLGLLVTALVSGAMLVALRWSIWSKEQYATCAVQASEFDTNMTCFRLPMPLMANQPYRITMAVNKAWADASISTDPQGFGPTSMTFVGNLWASMRRSPTARWFQPLIKIETPGKGDFRVQALEMRLSDPAHNIFVGEFVAVTDGDAYLFVNDVLLPEWADVLFAVANQIAHPFSRKPSPFTHNFYKNNEGTASVWITPCPGEPSLSCGSPGPATSRKGASLEKK